MHTNMSLLRAVLCFFAMFYGDLAQKEPIIRLVDTDEESFEEFLRFLYTDDCEITAENAIGVLCLAKKYLVTSLAEKCCNVLEASIEPDNVFAVLEQAIKFDEKKLEAKCWDIVTQTEVFCGVESNTLNSLLKKETLRIAAEELFKAVLKWVDKECARQGVNIEEDKTARRQILGDSVYEIPFLEMSQEDFEQYVSPTGVLKDAELVRIFQQFSSLDMVGLKWKQKKKQNPSLIGFSRFESRHVNNLSGSWTYNGRDSDALALNVSKPVLFHGVRLFGGHNGSQYEVKFKIESTSVTGRYTSEQDNDGVWGYDVMMKEPIPLQSNREGRIIATIKGQPSCYGTNGKQSVEINGIVMDFRNALCNCNENGTDTTHGQFYKIFLSKK